jgi:excinuclease ABC subunit C
MPSMISVPFAPELQDNSLFDSIPARPAVFALHLRETQGDRPAPYLGRTQDLRRRLSRLLRPSGSFTKLLNLRELVTSIRYQVVGSQLEGLWLLYALHREHYPRTYRQRLRLKSPILLKVNLQNRFPRCYPTRRMAKDGSLYYGPFASRPVAERFASDFLDLFKIRRCVEDLNPDPAHPGCIYSQMRMCLAPCFVVCTDEQYQQEVASVIAFLDSNERSCGLIGQLEAARAQASEALAFEEAARLHRRIEKVQEVMRQKPDIVRNVSDLSAILIERGAEPKSVVFFRLHAGEIRGPVPLSLDENVASPVPLDQQLHELLDPLGAPESEPRAVPSWEHLSLLSRWYYSSFRTGEILMLDRKQEIPHARLIRLCRKLTAQAP